MNDKRWRYWAPLRWWSAAQETRNLTGIGKRWEGDWGNASMKLLIKPILIPSANVNVESDDGMGATNAGDAFQTPTPQPGDLLIHLNWLTAATTMTTSDQVILVVIT